MNQGSCLCGGVSFQIAGELPMAYQCHCSLCQKATGSSANAGTFVKAGDFTWLSGEDQITAFKKSTGFRNDFCRTCGSSVPNPLRDTDLFWVPMGLIDTETDALLVAHLHLGSAPAWDDESDDCIWMEAGMESIDWLHRQLQRPNRDD